MTIDDLWLKDRADDLKAGIVFLTRLPLAGETPVSGGAIARAGWSFPIVGVLVGLTGAVVYALAHRIGLPAWPAAALAVAATMAVTGCLHEDGLADTTDGFGGGKTREQKLAIMRDSRIGTYGVCALVLSMLLRVSAVASLAEPWLVLLALIAAHGAARGVLPIVMFLLPAARSDGLSFAAGHPPSESVAVAALGGVLILALCLGPLLGMLTLLLLAVAVGLTAWLSLAQIDGQTGDVLGAMEQISEIVILLVALR
jgi:adenosylcobinamide-GDP ribazoletransferase